MTQPTTRSFKDPIVWTHSFLFGNVYLYGEKGYYIIGAVMFFNVIFSLAYHLSHEIDETYEDLDMIFCRITLGCISWYLLSSCSWLQISLSLIWLVASLIVLELGNVMDYRLFHSLWHFMVFGGNLIVWSYLPILW